MDERQLIVAPFGISVFGSALVRVIPDVAVLTLSVSRVQPQPQAAFQAVREVAQQVQTFLSRAQIKEVGTSRIKLREQFDHRNDDKQVGYETSVEFRVILYDLNRVEDIIIGVLEAGVNNIRSVDFETTQLTEIRAEARHKAIIAAHKKAEGYCAAAGVSLGELIHIEDLNPQQVPTRRFHTSSKISPEEEGDIQAFDPGSIVVAGSVMVAYKFQGH